MVPLDAARTAELFQVPLRAVEQISDDEYRIVKSRLPDAFCGNACYCPAYARMVPAFKNGVPDGIKIFAIPPASAYAQMGIENGDIIRRLNGEELSGPDKALDIYGKLRNDARIVVELERKGKILRKTYQLE